MIRIENAKESYKILKKEFKDVWSFAVIISPLKDNEAFITFRGFDRVNPNIMREYTVYGNTDYDVIKRITISSVTMDDAFIDFMFEEKGFRMDTYKSLYRDIKMVNDSNTECYLSEVVFFNSKGKKICKSQMCNPWFEMIE